MIHGTMAANVDSINDSTSPVAAYGSGVCKAAIVQTHATAKVRGQAFGGSLGRPPPSPSLPLPRRGLRCAPRRGVA